MSTDYRKPYLSELRPGDILVVTNKDNDISSDFVVVERKFLWLFPMKGIIELKLYSNEFWPLSYLKQKQVHWKIKNQTHPSQEGREK